MLRYLVDAKSKGVKCLEMQRGYITELRLQGTWPASPCQFEGFDNMQAQQLFKYSSMSTVKNPKFITLQLLVDTPSVPCYSDCACLNRKQYELLDCIRGQIEVRALNSTTSRHIGGTSRILRTRSGGSCRRGRNNCKSLPVMWTVCRFVPAR